MHEDDGRVSRQAIGDYDAWAIAQAVLPGGVNASARLNSVLGKPFFTSSGKGGVIVDVLGREYIDLSISNGASLLGYGHPSICGAVEQALREGILCAHETLHQISLAQRLTQLVPSAEMVRFCGTGTETTWYAIRLARAYTQRSIIIKFEGHFHGYNDYLAYSAWPPLDLAGPADNPLLYLETQGVPEAVRSYIIVLPFNNTQALEVVLSQRHQDIAAVILEPVNYNSGTILPLPGYLESVKELTAKYGVLLIFDEILSGFQTGPDCMQGYFHVTPDLTTLGKALGGGMPLSALVGKREIMEKLAPLGKAMHSGTYIAHPATVLAAIAFLAEIDRDDFYPALLGRCSYLIENMRSIFQKAVMTVKVQTLGARFSLLFGIPEEQSITNYREAAVQDRQTAQRFYVMMLEEGIYFNPGWHHGICAAHTAEQLDRVLESVERVVRRMTGEKPSLENQMRADFSGDLDGGLNDARRFHELQGR